MFNLQTFVHFFLHLTKEGLVHQKCPPQNIGAKIPTYKAKQVKIGEKRLNDRVKKSVAL